MHMQTKAFLVLTGVQIETYILHASSSNTLYPNTIPTPTHLHQHICYHLPKNTPKQVTEKALCQKVQKQVM